MPERLVVRRVWMLIVGAGFALLLAFVVSLLAVQSQNPADQVTGPGTD